jgi:outer membrane protein TolC
LALTWNIFDGHQRNIQREKLAVNLQTLEFTKINFMTQNEISKNKVLNQINSVIERISMNEKQVEKYKRLYEAYSKELTVGEASVMDFKNLMKDIAAKNQELLQLKMEQQFLINSYNYLNY